MTSALRYAGADNSYNSGALYAQGALSPRSRSSYKKPKSIISYIGGVNGTKESVLENAPGGPPPVEALGYYGLWKATRFGYNLAARNDNSRAALMRRGYPAPTDAQIDQALDDYWANLSDEDYVKLEGQLQALADEQGYTGPVTNLRQRYTRSALSPRSSSRSPRTSARRGGALSPRQISTLPGGGYTGSYSRQYGTAAVQE